MSPWAYADSPLVRTKEGCKPYLHILPQVAVVEGMGSVFVELADRMGTGLVELVVVGSLALRIEKLKQDKHVVFFNVFVLNDTIRK